MKNYKPRRAIKANINLQIPACIPSPSPALFRFSFFSGVEVRKKGRCKFAPCILSFSVGSNSCKGNPQRFFEL